jgi:hypothetical protein
MPSEFLTVLRRSWSERTTKLQIESGYRSLAVLACLPVDGRPTAGAITNAEGTTE